MTLSSSTRKLEDTPRALYPYRGAVAVALAVPLLWLLYVVTTAQRQAPVFRRLLEGIGGELPKITSALFVSYRWWWLFIACLAVLAVDVVRRSRPSPLYFAVVLGLTLLVAFALQAWLYEAFFLPLDHILQAIG